MRLLSLGLILLTAGCDDHLFPAASHGGGAPTESGWCGVQQVFQSQCLGCHGSGGLGGLDLATDPHAALVSVASSEYPGVVRVVPGDPDASLLYLKITGKQGDLGGPMPPGGTVDAASAELVRTWIADGAPSDCATAPTGPVGRYHPDGWADPGDHGLSAKLQEQRCTDCHGADLTGDIAPSCDTCHTEKNWRTTCTFCHGGVDGDTTGAPPEDIDDNTNAATISFPPHLTHVLETDMHVAFDCVQCHVKPTDILSDGHIFIGDTSPGNADVIFGAGLSPAGSYNGQTCSNLYCHGNGQVANGVIDKDAGDRNCASCHPSINSGEDAWKQMSGEHEEHIDEGVACSECHSLTTLNDTSIVANPVYHVNGQPDVKLPAGMQRVGGECTGSCHGENHDGRNW